MAPVNTDVKDIIFLTQRVSKRQDLIKIREVKFHIKLKLL